MRYIMTGNPAILLCVALTFSLVPTSHAQMPTSSWPQFRGPESQGRAVGEGGIPARFGPETNAAWKCPIGSGHSSPCVWDDSVFLTAQDGNRFETICIDRAKRTVRWRKSVEVDAIERHHRTNSAASPTPATDGRHVFVVFGSIGLLCYDWNGKELWRRPFKPARNSFGTAASPIVCDGQLIFNRDTNGKSWLENIDPATGKTLWHVDRTGFVSGWSTPTVWNNQGVAELLVYGAFKLTAYDLKTGVERWAVPGLADEPCITPAIGDGLIFVTSYNMRTNPEVIGLPEWPALLEELDKNKDGTIDREEGRKNRSILSRNDADGEGDHPLRIFWRMLDRDRDGKLVEKEWLGAFKHLNALVAIRAGDGAKKEPTIAWQYPRGVPECPSPLYHAGRVYLVKNGGIASCLDARTGELKWSERLASRGPYYASPIFADGKIFLTSARGDVTVMEPGDKFRMIARNRLMERAMATPAAVERTLFVRTAKHLWAFEEKTR